MDALAPLSGLLENLADRLAAIEAHLGIVGATPAASGSSSGAAKKKVEEPLSPVVLAWDALVSQHLTPFAAAASAIGDKAVDLVRVCYVLASRPVAISDCNAVNLTGFGTNVEFLVCVHGLRRQ
jgi:hypothetical protein